MPHKNVSKEFWKAFKNLDTLLTVLGIIILILGKVYSQLFYFLLIPLIILIISRRIAEAIAYFRGTIPTKKCKHCAEKSESDPTT